MFEQGQDCLALDTRQSCPAATSDTDLRDRAICERYRAGETLSAIGRSLDLSIEGVRKIARKYGLDKSNAGMAVRKRDKPAPHRARPLWERVYGCSLLEFCEATHAERMAFLQHRTNARRIAVTWELSLGEWIKAWRRSGKWRLRGQGPNKYGMTRIDVERGFRADNIRISRNGVSLRRTARGSVPAAPAAISGTAGNKPDSLIAA